MKEFRTLQIITGIHRIHHVQFGRGWKIPFTNMGYFPDYFEKFKNFSGATPWNKINKRHYHDCTETNIY